MPRRASSWDEDPKIADAFDPHLPNDGVCGSVREPHSMLDTDGAEAEGEVAEEEEEDGDDEDSCDDDSVSRGYDTVRLASLL